WKQWLSGIGQQDDVFLDEFNMHKKHLLLGGFAAAVREGRFSSTRHTLLGESTVRSTVDHIAQTYRAHHRRDQGTMKKDGWHSFYSVNSRDTRTPIAVKNHNKH
ncbi:MAG: hypothetical protein ACREBR_00420, partial [bacterium]